ncbi:thiol:disulfide interchange protein TlpA [Salinarimonas chemoclinalis]|uniref:thiol:disulfide interchange protein TlpA n=1 Tax=Salinarimonas chemoclinalis TaxID=3241599 RepID=UPI003557A5CE
MTDETKSHRPRGLRRGPIVVAGGLVVGALVAFALVSRNSEAVAEACIPAQETLARLAPTATGEVAAVSVHATPRLAPQIAFSGPQGEPLTLADFAGKAVLLNLWATWCAPCREEMPALDALQETYGGADFEVVAINVDTRHLDRPRAWLEEHGIDDLAYYAENDGTLMQTLQRSGHVVGLPTTILVDGAGCELAVLKGPAEWASEDAFAMIRTALGREGG